MYLSRERRPRRERQWPTSGRQTFEQIRSSVLCSYRLNKGHWQLAERTSHTRRFKNLRWIREIQNNLRELSKKEEGNFSRVTRLLPFLDNIVLSAFWFLFIWSLFLSLSHSRSDYRFGLSIIFLTLQVWRNRNSESKRWSSSKYSLKWTNFSVYMYDIHVIERVFINLTQLLGAASWAKQEPATWLALLSPL